MTAHFHPDTWEPQLALSRRQTPRMLQTWDPTGFYSLANVSEAAAVPSRETTWVPFQIQNNCD